MSKSTKNSKALNYSEHLLILASTITGRVFISSFDCLVGILIDIASYPVGTNICTITNGIKKYKSMIRKKKKIHNKNSIINKQEVK